MSLFNQIFRGKENKGLWADFYSLVNNSDILTQKAKVLAPLLIQSALSDQRLLESKLEEISSGKSVAPDFRERISSISPQAWNNAFYEVLLVFLHFSDRMAFQYLKPEEKNLFADALFSEIMSLLTKGIREYIPFATEHMLMETYNDRQGYYSTKELFPEGDKGFSDTVFWECGKTISEILTGEARDSRIILPVLIIVTSRVLSLEVPQLLTGTEIKNSPDPDA